MSEKYRITPKGVLTLRLVEDLDLPWDEAVEYSQTLVDDIFKAGYIYAHETEVEVVER